MYSSAEANSIRIPLPPYLAYPESFGFSQRLRAEAYRRSSHLNARGILVFRQARQAVDLPARKLSYAFHAQQLHPVHSTSTMR